MRFPTMWYVHNFFFFIIFTYEKNNEVSIDPDSVKLLFFSYPSILTCVLGALKNLIIETVLLGTHNICFG